MRICQKIGLTAGLLMASLAEEAKPELPKVHTSITINASPVEPLIDHRNKEVFEQTLFSGDDQVFHQFNAGINAGQHEGGGKSIEIRNFGFNLDHGGVSGGMKILVDNVQQNQTTQGHGQGYLGSLKSLTPELIQWRLQRAGRGSHPAARIAARSVHHAHAGRVVQHAAGILRV